MKTITIEIAGNEKPVHIFSSMWEYIQHYGATVEDYELVPAEFQGEQIVGSFKPVDDVFFGTHSSDMVYLEDVEGVEDGYYQHVNWGEDDYAMIPEGDIDAVFWTVYRWNAKLGGYQAVGEIFETREDAEKELI